MASNPDALRELRRAWQCDCDGAELGASPRAQGPRVAVEAMGGAIEKLTGSRPRTCPWRVFYSALVRETIRLASMSEDGAVSAQFGDDPPAILLDALAVYSRARRVTMASDQEADRKRRERERGRR